MSLLFRHNKEVPEYPEHQVGKQRGTVALEKPHALEIMQEMRKQYTKSCMKIPKITVNIGGAFAHYKDPFNKKTGRDMATARVKPIEFTIGGSGYDNDPEAIMLSLTGVDKTLEVQYTIGIKLYRDSGELRIMHIQTRSWE